MERPTTVKVGPFTYSIQYKENMTPYDHLAGMTDNHELEIWVKMSGAEMKMREVLVHEVSHAIMHVYGGDIAADETSLPVEQMVHAVGFGWLQVMCDNRFLVTYLQKED